MSSCSHRLRTIAPLENCFVSDVFVRSNTRCGCICLFVLKGDGGIKGEINIARMKAIKSLYFYTMLK